MNRQEKLRVSDFDRANETKRFFRMLQNREKRPDFDPFEQNPIKHFDQQVGWKERKHCNWAYMRIPLAPGKGEKTPYLWDEDYVITG